MMKLYFHCFNSFYPTSVFPFRGWPIRWGFRAVRVNYLLFFANPSRMIPHLLFLLNSQAKITAKSSLTIIYKKCVKKDLCYFLDVDEIPLLRKWEVDVSIELNEIKYTICCVCFFNLLRLIYIYACRCQYCFG